MRDVKANIFRMRRAKIEKKQLNLILKLYFLAKIAPEGAKKNWDEIFKHLRKSKKTLRKGIMLWHSRRKGIMLWH